MGDVMCSKEEKRSESLAQVLIKTTTCMIDLFV